MPQDARGRLALAGGLLCILGAIGTVARARHLQHTMQVEGVPATPDWTIAMRDARRPDDLVVGGALLGIAGVGFVAWSLLRATGRFGPSS